MCRWHGNVSLRRELVQDLSMLVRLLPCTVFEGKVYGEGINREIFGSHLIVDILAVF